MTQAVHASSAASANTASLNGRVFETAMEPENSPCTAGSEVWEKIHMFFIQNGCSINIGVV